MVHIRKEINDKSKEDQLIDLQLKQQRIIIKQMEREKRKERMQKISSVVKRAGSFAVNTVVPKQEMPRKDSREDMFRFPHEMFDNPNNIGNSSSTRGKKIYRRRVR